MGKKTYVPVRGLTEKDAYRAIFGPLPPIAEKRGLVAECPKCGIRTRYYAITSRKSATTLGKEVFVVRRYFRCEECSFSWSTTMIATVADEADSDE